MEVRPHAFRPHDLVGGHVVLDLVNTVTARNADQIDWLDGYPRLLEWAALTGEFDPRALAELKRRIEADRRGATVALGRVRAFRETLADVLTATIRGEAAPEGALDGLDRYWRSGVARARLDISAGRGSLQLSVETSGMDYLRHVLALRSFDLLREIPLERMRICAGPRCGWLFIDGSKGGQRRWCDMATCGNAAKSRRHYHRAQEARRASRLGDG